MSNKIFDSGDDYKPEKNPYWYMRVYWWEGWGCVAFVAWTLAALFLGGALL